MTEGLRPDNHQTLHDTEASLPRWEYTPLGKGDVALSADVNYFADISDPSRFNARNDIEGRRSVITESSRSLAHDGVYVGIVRAKDASGDLTERLLFRPAVPMDEATAGDQPPITGRYPRVVFPSEGAFRYGIAFLHDANIFGPHTAEVTVSVPKFYLGEIPLPKDCPCPNGVREALKTFNNGSYTIPPGEYKLKLTIDDLPAVSIRIDGGRPLGSKLYPQTGTTPELPIMDALIHPKVESIDLGKPGDRNPFLMPSKIKQYQEIPSGTAPTAGESAYLFANLRVEIGGKEERADLVYQSLRREESILLDDSNPFLGLVEVQVDRVSQLTHCEVDFTPSTDSQDFINPYFRDDYLGGLTRGSGGDMRSFSGHTASVNTGKTVAANPRRGPVSPKVAVEWNAHIHTFRLCLTNGIN